MNDSKEIIKKKETILIIGINSFVGSNLAEFFKSEFRVVGTYHHKYIPIKGVLSLPCNVLSKEELQLVMYAFKPDIVIYAVGLTGLAQCQASPNTCDALNSSGLFNITELAPRYGARVIYLSSQYVFSGENRKYNEMDNPDVLTHYGKAIASSEFYLQKSSLNYLVIRCCPLYGRGINPLRSNFFEVMQKKLLLGESMLFDDFLSQGFIDIYYLAFVLKMCIQKNVSNRLLHFSTQDIVTTYRFFEEYCQVFGASEGLGRKGKWPFPALKGVSVPERQNYHLDILNIEGLLKIKMPTVRESLELTYARMHGKENLKLKSSSSDEIKFI